MSLFWSEPSFTTVDVRRNFGTIPRLFSQIPTSLIPPQRCTISLRRASNLFPAQSQRRLYCNTMNSVSSSMEETNSFSSTAIFVKGLPQSTSEGTLRSAFSKFGEVSRVKMIRYEKSKGSAGFAYVWFVNGECAENAVVEMNGKFFEGRFILVEMAKPGSCKIRKDGTPYKF
ncbi:glycine-rich RNA-binding protein 4, mitochondrial-like isoform X2 [Impatiens glandulifera]|uniref:glycine-rich RNA-binding protein 4, mitochondrial-like isoform X2 n=1 Tax=Impatiens glandulifera TaxID=253017 RepID=UPI001FB08B2C|nr:glycine-rich RNA-binding protein 4, mitochondrial-like isoform X2 [Impatiens glandulifera]